MLTVRPMNIAFLPMERIFPMIGRERMDRPICKFQDFEMFRFFTFEIWQSEICNHWIWSETMKILVTGGCGFIGSNFIRYFLEILSGLFSDQCG